MPRHLFGIPALSVAGAYVVALVVAAVIALASGDLAALWWLAVFDEPAAGAAATWPDVLILVAAGMPWAWAIWQCLRGPSAGPPPEPDRDTRRLRLALYAASATWLPYFFVPSWPWWLTVVDAAAMCVVVVLFRPVLNRHGGRADFMTAGLLAYGGTAVIEVLDVLGYPGGRALVLLCGLAGLVWTVLVLLAQRADGRWRPDTVRYGFASLLAPLVLGVAGPLLASRNVLYEDAATAADALILIWLARSAHDLAERRDRAAPRTPVSQA